MGRDGRVARDNNYLPSEQGNYLIWLGWEGTGGKEAGLGMHRPDGETARATDEFE
jgi:hypothetical protein